MTVDQLKKMLENMPGDLEVFVSVVPDEGTDESVWDPPVELLNRVSLNHNTDKSWIQLDGWSSDEEDEEGD